MARKEARTLSRLSLGDALGLGLVLVELYATKPDVKYERRAAVPRPAHEFEVPSLTLEEAAVALNALLLLDRLPADRTARETLAALCRRRGRSSRLESYTSRRLIP